MNVDKKPKATVLFLAIWADVVGLSYLCGFFLAGAKWSDLYASWLGALMLLCAIVVSVIGVVYTIAAILAHSRA